MWKRVAGQYVVLGLVERAAHAVVRIREAKRGIGAADGLFNFEGFRKEFGDKVNAENILSEGDVRVLVKFLERDRKVVIVDKEVRSSQNVVCYLMHNFDLGYQIRR